MDDRIEQARQIDIVSYLSSVGHSPVRSTSKTAYYCSPLRSESSPSFSVDLEKNRWIDYGLSSDSTDKHFGDTIDLHRRLTGQDLPKALDALLGDERPAFTKPDKIIQEDALEVLEVQDEIENEALIEYFEKERGIPLTVLNQYCSQLLFQFASKKSRRFYGVGMKNEKGGFSIRSTWFKGACKPAGVSFFGIGSNGAAIFEGLADALSYVAMKRGAIDHDIFVLNSLVFLTMLWDRLREYDICNFYLDQGAAADASMEDVSLQGLNYVDHRYSYSEFGDYNEWWVNQTNKV